MAKPAKGQRLVCVPYGREVVVNDGGLSTTELWCCGMAMKPRAKSRPHKKAVRKKT